MIRDDSAIFETQLDYRPTGRVGPGVFQADIELQKYLTPTADPIAGPLADATAKAADAITAAVDAVAGGPVGQERDRLREQLDSLTKQRSESAAKVHDLEKKRADALKAGKGPTFREVASALQAARSQYMSAEEIVRFATNELTETEQRLLGLLKQARQDAIRVAIAEAQAALEESERSAVVAITESLVPVYIQTQLLGDLNRQLEGVRRRDPKPVAHSEPLKYETAVSPFAPRQPKVVPYVPDTDEPEPARFVDALTTNAVL